MNKKIQKISMILLFLIAFISISIAVGSTFDNSKNVSFSGRITDLSGVPIEVPTDFNFYLYDASTGGNLLLSKLNETINVNSGIWTTTIDVSVISPYSGDLWLEVMVEGETIPSRYAITSQFSSLTTDFNATGLNIVTDQNIHGDNLFINVVWADSNHEYGTVYCVDGNVVTGYLVGFTC